MKCKKLLILGATAGEIALIRRAQAQGIYVIATDNHMDYSLAPAKRIANEAWDISWSDLDEDQWRPCGLQRIQSGQHDAAVQTARIALLYQSGTA